jgi:hypothetical protein
VPEQLAGLELANECTKLLEEVAQAPARRTLVQQRKVLSAQYDAADAAGDFKAIAAAGMQLQALQQQSAQLPLSEKGHLTLGDRHADLVRRVTEKCKELTRAKEYAEVTALGAKLAELRAATWPAAESYAGARHFTGKLFYLP